MSITIADVLDRAADLIEPEGAWTQGEFARGADYQPVGHYDNRAVCFCVLGAIGRVAGHGSIYNALNMPAIDALREAIGRRVPAWNDAPERTQAEVVAKLREAAALARGQGK